MRPREPSPADAVVDVARVAALWWPLAASWLLMAMEPNIVIAAVSRLTDSKLHLGAWSSVVFPISLVVEGPIIMMLAASTRLSSDWDRYRRVMRYGSVLGVVLTAVHAAIAFTPLYWTVAQDVMGSTPEVARAARPGLMMMLPWTFAIGYRRTCQGTLIRFERSGAVSQGTLLRLLVTGTVLTVLVRGAWLSGTATAAIGVSSGVTAEALFAGWKVRSVFPALQARPADAPLSVGGFARFYGPLALTPLITLLIQPIGAAAMNRMPRSLDSVASWGPVHGLTFTARSVGMAFNEVVVTLVALRGGARALTRFGVLLGAATTLAVGLLWATPLATLWFGTVQTIPADLVPLARLGVGLSVLMPAYQVAQSWFQGLLVHAQTTRPITEAVLVYFLVAGLLLRLGTDLAWDRYMPGLVWTLCSFVTAGLCQTAWLWLRSRNAAREAGRAL